jgi:thiamine biosynthesis lipoprotein ApbE
MTEPSTASNPRFSHQAMGTIFDIFIAGEDPDYGAQAAQTAFREIDRLERLFSRFDPASEISRINRLKPGEEMTIGFETYECLALAETVRRETGGAFDVNARAAKTTGPTGYPEGFSAPLKNHDGEASSQNEPAENNNRDLTAESKTLSPKIARPIAIGVGSAEAPRTNVRESNPSRAVRDSSPEGCLLDPAKGNRDSDGFRFRRHTAEKGVFRNLDLDLGAVGKGYALDKALDVLREWGVENALLHGGTSTAVAIGSPESYEKSTAAKKPAFMAEDALRLKTGAPASINHSEDCWIGNPAVPTLPGAMNEKEELVLFVPLKDDRNPNQGKDTGEEFDRKSGWPVGVGAGWPGAPSRVLLSGRALSGSGTEVKGEHILDPRTGAPARRHLAAWASSPTAALSDALSTAFFVMTPEEIEGYIALHSDIWACIVVAYGDVRVYNSELLL